MSRFNDEHLKLLVLDPAKDTVMAGAVSPELTEITEVTSQPLAELAWVIAPRDIVIEIGEDTLAAFWPYFAHLLMAAVVSL